MWLFAVVRNEVCQFNIAYIHVFKVSRLESAWEESYNGMRRTF